MKKEEFAYIKGYRITDLGKITNKNNEEILGHTNGRYVKFKIRNKTKYVLIKVHRLQAFQKYGQDIYKEGIVTRHKNGISTDNSWDNILIGTQSENMMDIPESIRISKALYATSFVRKYDKEEIKLYHSIDKSYKKTMEKFNITSKGTLHFILNN